MAEVTEEHVDELDIHPENPRKGNVDQIAESIDENGWYGTLVAQESTRRVLVGNHRLKAARQIGMETVPVMWVDVDDDHARRILLSDNRLSDLAGYDEEALAEMLEELEDADQLAGTGYDADYLDKLMTELEGQEQATNRSNLPTRESVERYEETDLRQIVLLMTVDEYEWMLDGFRAIMEANDGIDTNFDCVYHLLETYQAEHTDD